MNAQVQLTMLTSLKSRFLFRIPCLVLSYILLLILLHLRLATHASFIYEVVFLRDPTACPIPRNPTSYATGILPRPRRQLCPLQSTSGTHNLLQNIKMRLFLQLICLSHHLNIDISSKFPNLSCTFPHLVYQDTWRTYTFGSLVSLGGRMMKGDFLLYADDSGGFYMALSWAALPVVLIDVR
jgi:hypothetical protein